VIGADAIGFYFLAVPAGLVVLAVVTAIAERISLLVDHDRRWDG
jgi:hypothetical protein